MGGQLYQRFKLGRLSIYDGSMKILFVCMGSRHEGM
jgi:hypothetical protein